MSHVEALKLALEALQDNQHLVADNERHAYVMEYNDLIEKCKEALAQQCVCGEPNSAGTHRTDGPCLAPQRTWVWLTEDERTNIRAKVGEYTDFKRWDYTKRVQEATELALKEKNA